ncbi:XdhC family protein [Methylomarinum sp. Ch1-1]|uniref:XdhC family protein n=1 Tax=Methylomarinum roseum TaxID=3067653 RepID=A0AAU7NVM0_9GAMM|nr:XdhC/CoxI family protein [Methylomarinum sp. Ch1-1]MDP4522903.1 XdhC family protein [Methylomarinum sp. Ch1-1]
MTTNKINHLIDAYRRLRQQAEPLVLASIIETRGSTYQKAGARMLIARNGEMTGLLGGGCFENDLLEQARSVFETGQAKTLFYDMRAPDDVIWGLGLGCNGAVKILLQLLRPEQDFSPLNLFVEAADGDATGVLVTFYESGHPDYLAGSSVFLPASTIDHTRTLTTDASRFQPTAEQALLQLKPHHETHRIDGHRVQAFYAPIRPPSRLLVVGAGADAQPLVQYAASLGWRVSVVDYRPNHIKHERFSEAQRLMLLTPHELNAKLALNRFDAMVLMTHNFDYDRRYLQQIAGSSIPFIGLLGPALRRDMLLKSLGTEAEKIRDRVYGPVGLDIGAQNPEEIALSIMSGIHAALNRCDGGQLDRKTVAAADQQSDDCFVC